MDAQELCGIETTLEVGNGLVDAVAVAGYDSKGELVLGDEVGDVVEREK